jgi:DNA invertase Pin-like site-specific DNA recombinase
MKKKERGPEDETLMNVFVAAGTAAEMEAQSIHGLLEASGIESFIVRENVTELPVGRVEIRVPASLVERARQIILEGQRAGPAGAEEAEAESEL